MKKYFLLLILPFLFIPSVKADDCTEYITSSNNFSFNTRYARNYLNITSNNLPDGTYTFYVTDGQTTFREYFTSNYELSPEVNFYIYLFYTLYECDLDSTYCSGAKDSTNRTAVTIGANNISYDLTQNITDFHLVHGTSSCIPEPTPEPDSNNVYSSFITLYLDKISYLAYNFTTNPYLLSMLGIIFSFIVLELFLHIIHIKGGYKK